MQITVHDESISGQTSNALTLEILTESMTVRELIRSRVYQEVHDFNHRPATLTFNGLVQPTDTEQTLNGFRLKERRTLDWRVHFEKALKAFMQNGFFILIDDRQAEDLDEQVTLRADSKVSFVKLVPLVGG